MFGPKCYERAKLHRMARHRPHTPVPAGASQNQYPFQPREGFPMQTRGPPQMGSKENLGRFAWASGVHLDQTGTDPEKSRVMMHDKRLINTIEFPAGP